MSFFPYLVAIWLLCAGLYGVVTSRNFVHLVISLSVAQSATYVLLLAIGFERGAKAPIFSGVAIGTPAVDPVVQALAMVDVVVQAIVSALLLAIAVQAHQRFGTVDPEELRPMRG